jgi:uncharacterized protein YndB with AHSA1/START domain
MTATSDRIERTILLKAPRSRVWRALSNAEEFGDWFGVALKGESSTAGQRVRGHVTHRGYEHVVLEMSIEGMESESLLSWHWHPAAIEPSVDYSQEPTTLVVFDLQEVQGGTRLNIVESGFDGVPPARRLEAFRLNSGGWDGQIDNIAKHVEAS